MSIGTEFFNWFINHYNGPLPIDEAYAIWQAGYLAGQPARKGGE
jgi:hypothetical protein